MEKAGAWATIRREKGLHQLGWCCISPRIDLSYCAGYLLCIFPSPPFLTLFCVPGRLTCEDWLIGLPGSLVSTWIQPMRGFGGRSEREGKCEFPVLPPYWFTTGWLSPHQWMTHVSPATWPSPNSYSLWVPVTAFLLCLFRQVKGWQRVPTIASPWIPHHPSLVSLTSAGTTDNSPFIKVSVALEWMWCWLLARTQPGKLVYFMIPITTYILL